MKKRANSIQLYNAGIVLAADGEDMFGRIGTFEHIVVGSSEVEGLLEALQIPVDFFERGELLVERRLLDLDADNLIAVYAEVIAANLLEIELVYRQSPPSPDYHQHITYSGYFAVDWTGELPE